MIVIVDTNIYFSALYNPEGNEAKIVRKANTGEVTLLSPDTVKGELMQVLKTKLGWNEEKASSRVETLPTIWVPEAEYSIKLPHAKPLITHEEDSPILACALRLETGILTGDTRHFDTPKIREKIPLWSSRKLLQYLKSKESR